MIVSAAQNQYGNLFLWCLILLALWVKRRTQQTDSGPTIGFSLADLRELHRTGKISDQEFERARGKMAASLKREAQQAPKKSK